MALFNKMNTSSNYSGLPIEILKQHLETEIMNAALQLKCQEFWHVTPLKGEQSTIYASHSHLLWQGAPNINDWFDSNSGEEHAAHLTWASIKEWRLPTEQEMLFFVKSEKNPLRQGDNYRLLSCWPWLISGARLELDYLNVFPMMDGLVIACNDYLYARKPTDVIRAMLEQGWILTPTTNGIDLLKDAKEIMLHINYATQQEKSIRDIALSHQLTQLIEHSLGNVCNDYLKHLANSHSYSNAIKELLATQTQKSRKV